MHTGGEPIIVQPRSGPPETPTVAPVAPGRKKTGGLTSHLFSIVFVVALFGAAGLYFSGRSVGGLNLRHMIDTTINPPKAALPPALAVPPRTVWDGLVDVSAKEREAIGFRLFPVTTQIKPSRLELSGTTDYDQNTITRIRPLFDARVQAVFKATGQSVKKGEPLVELYSNELAAAKNDLRKSYVQWDHDHKLLDSRRSLAEKGQITQLSWVDTQNAEKTSRLLYLQARDKLIVFGMENDEVEKLLANLRDANIGSLAPDDVHDISKMTLRSPIDGIIIERNVVAGNYYDGLDTLMVISPVERLWIWGNLFEKDQEVVRLGQAVEVAFPFSDRVVEGKVEQIESRVDPVTRSVRIRATISNADHALKADMLVSIAVMIPPEPGHTVIPRNAMNVVNGEPYVFVQKTDNPGKFERRNIRIVVERSDTVVVSSGLKPGEIVVSNGSLVLAQLYEDLEIVESGLPSK